MLNKNPLLACALTMAALWGALEFKPRYDEHERIQGVAQSWRELSGTKATLAQIDKDGKKVEFSRLTQDGNRYLCLREQTSERNMLIVCADLSDKNLRHDFLVSQVIFYPNGSMLRVVWFANGHLQFRHINKGAYLGILDTQDVKSIQGPEADQIKVGLMQLTIVINKTAGNGAIPDFSKKKTTAKPQAVTYQL